MRTHLYVLGPLGHTQKIKHLRLGPLLGPYWDKSGIAAMSANVSASRLDSYVPRGATLRFWDGPKARKFKTRFSIWEGGFDSR